MLRTTGSVEILRTLIDHGADVAAVDANQSTAFHAAALSDNTEVIDMLVEAGANIEARDCDACTPLHNATISLSHEALLCLLKHGANVNAQNSEFETPLMSAAKEAGTQGVAEVVNSLLRVDSDETIVDMF